jgi:hypothetical protein
MSEPEPPRFHKVKDKRKMAARTSKAKIGKSSRFSQDVNGKKRQAVSVREGARAKKGDAIAGIKKEAKRRKQ